MSTEEILRKEIKEQLENVNSKNAPKIYKRIQKQDGYQEIEARIIIMIVNDGITPSACIPQIESEL